MLVVKKREIKGGYITVVEKRLDDSLISDRM